MQRNCIRCDQPFEGRTQSVRCPPCQRLARKDSKSRYQARRYQEDLAYRALNQSKCKEWHRENPSKAAIIERRRSLRHYGLTLEDYDRMLAEQGGVCAICGRVETCSRLKNLAVDHDAVTGRVRGLLCSNCNVGLGKFQHSPGLLQKAIDYLT